MQELEYPKKGKYRTLKMQIVENFISIHTKKMLKFVTFERKKEHKQVLILQ